MCVGWAPDMATSDLTEKLTSQESTIILMANKCVKEFEDLPTSLRKPKGKFEVLELQLHCRGFEVCLATFKQMVPDDMYNMHKEALHTKFMSGFMDMSLSGCIDMALTSIDIMAIPEFRLLANQVQEEARRKDLEKSADLKAKLLQASYEDLSHTLSVETEKVRSYYKEVALQDSTWNDREVAHKRKLAKAGCKACDTYMANHLQFFDATPESPDAMLLNYNSCKHDVLNTIKLSDNAAVVWTFLILDLTVCPNMDVLEARILDVANILHSDERSAAFIFFPKTHKRLDVARQLALTRRIEDRLLAHKLNIEKEVNLHYEITDAHGNDNRTLTHRCRLCVSARVGEKSAWLRGELARGKATVPLLRVRDMTVMTEVSIGDPSRDLTPAERLVQKGTGACKS